AEAPPGFTEDQRGIAGGFVGDPDVLDTWATSSLTPLIPTGWPDAARFENLYPTDLRPQAHEIIRTWAFYTIVRSLLKDGSVPWWHVAISGWVLDPDRKKMSKSKGNVVLPTDSLDEYGSDAVRYWAGSARLGVDTAADPNVFREGKRLVTKLRNAARLIGGFEGEGGAPTHPLDLALLGRLRDVITSATDHWEAWDHAGALETVERWFWDDFCDNYLELSKARAYDRDPSALGTLRKALDVVLRLFAPYLPFTTEELWNAAGPMEASIHIAPWPTVQEVEGTDDDVFDVAVDVLTQIRKTKSESKVSIKTPVEMLRVEASEDLIASLERVKDDVLAAGNVLQHEFVSNGSSELTVTIELGTPTSK
ncbi:MAG: valine--tRNA ligase, partial [Actinomycetota bacterium]|nr:valine--tRNA ligase [Actinomycetota bacterium]